MWIGKEALTVLIILAALTGLIIYPTFHSIAPVPGNMFSLYRMNLTPQDIAAANPQSGASGSTAASSSPVGASVTILAGAQGNPAYSPDAVTASAKFGTTKLAAGNYPFHCSVHPYMTGSLKVQ